MPALHAVQHHAGYIDPTLVPLLADTFNLSVAEVHGVIYVLQGLPHHAAGRSAGPGVSRRGLPVPRRSEPSTRPPSTLRPGSPWRSKKCSASACARRVRPWPPRAACTPASPPRASPRSSVALPDASRSPTAVPTGPATASPVYVPVDAAARSAGADDVAAAFAAQPGVRVVRNGSRGMLWLEPLVEVATAAGPHRLRPRHSGRRAGPRSRPGCWRAATTPLRLGRARARCRGCNGQQRVTFGRVGVVDPRDADDYVAHGGMAGLASCAGDAAGGRRRRGHRERPARSRRRGVPQWYQAAHRAGHAGRPQVRRVQRRRGRQRLASPTGCSWRAIRSSSSRAWPSPGGPSVRTTATCTSAASTRMPSPPSRSAIATAESLGWLTGPGAQPAGVLGSDFAFRLHVRVGAGAYICGEETALMESIEGRRGIVRAKPPLPAIEGLWGKPTVINNVLSLAALPVGAGRRRRRVRIARPRPQPRHAGGPTRRQRGPRRHHRGAVRHHRPRARRAVGWRHRQRAPGAHGAGRWPARCLPVRRADRPAGRLRGLQRRRGIARPRQHRRVRRHGGHGSDGPLRDGVLRRGVVRQVHAVPHRQHPRRGAHRQDRRRRRPRQEHRGPRSTCARSWPMPRCARWVGSPRCPCAARCATSPTTSIARRAAERRTERPYDAQPLDAVRRARPRHARPGSCVATPAPAHRVEVTIDGTDRRRRRRARRSCAPRRSVASTSPSSAPPTGSIRSAPAVCASSRSTVARARPRRAPRRSRRA